MARNNRMEKHDPHGLAPWVKRGCAASMSKFSSKTTLFTIQASWMGSVEEESSF